MEGAIPDSRIRSTPILYKPATDPSSQSIYRKDNLANYSEAEEEMCRKGIFGWMWHNCNLYHKSQLFQTSRECISCTHAISFNPGCYVAFISLRLSHKWTNFKAIIRRLKISNIIFIGVYMLLYVRKLIIKLYLCFKT